MSGMIPRLRRQHYSATGGVIDMARAHRTITAIANTCIGAIAEVNIKGTGFKRAMELENKWRYEYTYMHDRHGQLMQALSSRWATKAVSTEQGFRI